MHDSIRPITKTLKKILIINPIQFGYHIDSYKYMRLLSRKCDITYICWDYEYSRINGVSANIKYVKRNKNKIIRIIKLYWRFYSEIKRKYDIVFLTCGRGYFVFRLLSPNQRFVYDIRPGSISRNNFKRRLKNFLIKLDTLFFDNITIISECLKNKFNIRIRKAYILPLGGDSHANLINNFLMIIFLTIWFY